MPRVICDLPNASDEIGGVKFHPLEDGGRISDEISDEQAARFASIPGYAIDEDGHEPPKAEVKPAPVARKSGGKKAAEPAPVAPVVETQPEQPEPAAVEPEHEAGEGETVF